MNIKLLKTIKRYKNKYGIKIWELDSSYNYSRNFLLSMLEKRIKIIRKKLAKDEFYKPYKPESGSV